MSECIFCKIVKGEIPCDKVFETEHILAFRDISPQAPTHVLIIPKKHISGVMDLAKADAPLLLELHQAAQKIAEQENLVESGFRLVTNHGAGAGQTVFHLHYHLLGGRTLQWPPG